MVHTIPLGRIKRLELPARGGRDVQRDLSGYTAAEQRLLLRER